MLSQITSVVNVTSAFQSSVWKILFRLGFQIIRNVAVTNVRLRNDELLDMGLPKY